MSSKMKWENIRKRNGERIDISISRILQSSYIKHINYNNSTPNKNYNPIKEIEKRIILEEPFINIYNININNVYASNGIINIECVECLPKIHIKYFLSISKYLIPSIYEKKRFNQGDIAYIKKDTYQYNYGIITSNCISTIQRKNIYYLNTVDFIYEFRKTNRNKTYNLTKHSQLDFTS